MPLGKSMIANASRPLIKIKAAIGKYQASNEKYFHRAIRLIFINSTEAMHC